MHPDAASTIPAGYDVRPSAEPGRIAALDGASFAHRRLFSYAQATHLLNQLLAERPNDVHGNLFRGSSRVLRRDQRPAFDIEKALALAPRTERRFHRRRRLHVWSG